MLDVVHDFDVLADILGAPSWQADSLCLEHPEIDFFTERGQHTAPTKAICARCLVRAECLDYALDNHIDHGIWGGTSPQERRRLQRERPARPAVRVAPRRPPKERQPPTAEERARNSMRSNVRITEMRVAHQVGILRAELQSRALELWGRSFIAERERRMQLPPAAHESTLEVQRRRQIYAELVRELRYAERARTA